MKQLAWLHATPEGKKESREQEYRSRYGDACPELDLPEVEAGEHIVGYLFEVGPAVRGEELTQADLYYWQENEGAVLSQFESSMLVRLSREYLAMRKKASEKVCAAPWRRERTDDEKAERARQQIEARKARARAMQTKTRN